MRSAFKGKHPKDGALAQLGERNTGSVEVSGSIPLGSTKSRSNGFPSRPKARFQRAFLFILSPIRSIDIPYQPTNLGVSLGVFSTFI